MLKILVAAAIIFSVLAAWIGVQFLARHFAARHPELGPAREEGTGCGKDCGCAKGRCRERDKERGQPD